MNKVKTIIPVIAAFAVIGAVTYSLSKYEPPVYSSQDFAIESAAESDDPASTLVAPILAESKELPEKNSATDRTASAGSVSLSSLGASLASATYKDGTYRGTGTGFNGPIVVDVTIRDGKIYDISVISSNDDAEYFNKAKSILNRIISTQSTNVDTVSGATYSSVGLINACINALSKAAVTQTDTPTQTASVVSEKNGTNISGKKSSSVTVPAATASDNIISGTKKGNYPYPDGTYTGTAMGFSGNITVAVTLKDQYIISIEIISHNDDDEFITSASAVMTTMINTQNTNVDTVSGATFSSEGIIAAVQNALDAAKHSSDTTDTSVDTSRIAGNTNSSENNPRTEIISGSTSTDVNSGNNGTGVISNTERPTASSGISEPVQTPTTSTPETDTTPVVDPTGGSQTTPSDNNTVNIYKNGVYNIGTYCNKDDYDDNFDEYILYMDINIANDKIISIDNLKGTGPKYNDRYISRASSVLIPAIIKAGNADNVDAVSGATFSSYSIIEACKEAFNLAKQ